MKKIYKIILLLTPLFFMGCEDSNKKETQNKSDIPESPILGEQEKVPPSIPEI